jgi:predicted enzyme related to lactoylglutathione lyase
MQFGYTILYVDDVASTLAFYEKAFALPTRMLHESGGYGELETGATALAFASRAMLLETLALAQAPGNFHITNAPRSQWLMSAAALS